MNNIFIEGLQGAGKTTLMRHIKKEVPNYQFYYEGDISPISLAWCSYMSKCEYEKILEQYPDIKSEIEKYSITEEENKIISYTRILTDYEGFHKKLEEYSIYHGNIPFIDFKDIIMKRYKNLNTSGNVFESSFFQYTITTLMLFYEMSNYEIMEFYREVFGLLRDKNFKLIYIDINNIDQVIGTTSKERTDLWGNEIWLPPLIRYVETSPRGINEGYFGIEGLLGHLEERRALELNIMEEVIKDSGIVIEYSEIFDLDLKAFFK